MWLLIITATIENSSVYLNHLAATVFLVYFNEGRRESSAQLPAGTQRKAVVVQQAYVNKKKKKKKQGIDEINTDRNSLMCLSYKQVNLKNTTSGKCDSLIPSPVKGRLPLTRATDGTGDNG